MWVYRMCTDDHLLRNIMLCWLGESHAIRLMISDLSNTQNQWYEYMAAIDCLSLKFFFEKDSPLLMLIMYKRHRRTNYKFMLTLSEPHDSNWRSIVGFEHSHVLSHTCDVGVYSAFQLKFLLFCIPHGLSIPSSNSNLVTKILFKLGLMILHECIF